MPKIKLGKLPNRTRVKLTLDLPPELDELLKLYATFYVAEYGEEVTVAEVAPYIMAEYIATDRDFQRSRREAALEGKP